MMKYVRSVDKRLYKLKLWLTAQKLTQQMKLVTPGPNTCRQNPRKKLLNSSLEFIDIKKIREIRKEKSAKLLGFCMYCL